MRVISDIVWYKVNLENERTGPKCCPLLLCEAACQTDTPKETGHARLVELRFAYSKLDPLVNWPVDAYDGTMT